MSATVVSLEAYRARRAGDAPSVHSGLNIVSRVLRAQYRMTQQDYHAAIARARRVLEGGGSVFAARYHATNPITE